MCAFANVFAQLDIPLDFARTQSVSRFTALPSRSAGVAWLAAGLVPVTANAGCHAGDEP
jgi:hypothetical protein